MSNQNSYNREGKIDHPHARKPKEIIEELQSHQERGLSQNEAEKRLETYGPNQLQEHEEKSLFQILIDQINNPVVYLLTAAAVLAFLFGDLPEGVAILVVLLLNTIIGFWMEYRARQSMNALREMDKVTAKVLRDGEVKEMDAEHLVPGDIIKLEVGDLIPADGRLIEVSELSIDEAPLTGESDRKSVV